MAKMKVNQDLCIGCGACVDSCPNEIFTMGNDGKAKTDTSKDCQEPNDCIDLCPVQAISGEE